MVTLMSALYFDTLRSYDRVAVIPTRVQCSMRFNISSGGSPATS
jgi:hypothetical protein